MIELLAQRGGQVIKSSVVGFNRNEGIKSLQLDNGAVLPADEVVVCAGAYTGQLSRMLDEVIPLETERGYSTPDYGSAGEAPALDYMAGHGVYGQSHCRWNTCRRYG